MSIKVIVVDDAVVFRKLISDTLTRIKGIEVIAVAGGGRSAIAKIQALKPDLITLDIEMPEMDGFQVIEEIRNLNLKTDIVVVSSFTARGSKLTIKALKMGAFDFVTKPSRSTYEENRNDLLAELEQILNVYQRRREIKEIFSSAKTASQKKITNFSLIPEQKERAWLKPDFSDKKKAKVSDRSKPSMVLIAVSTGGPRALSELIPRLPKHIGVPIFVVQHMPPVFTKSLAEDLNERSALYVKEAENAEKARQDTVYIAPGGKQMKLNSTSSGGIEILISDDPPEKNCKPSADYLFRSSANSFPGRAMAIILTGMGDDGTLGLRLLKRHKCIAIAQDEASSVVFGMPKAAIETGFVDCILPIEKISDEIVSKLGVGNNEESKSLVNYCEKSMFMFCEN
ncbi:MAG: chemotaxis response regulator protein-glutamate methylesterase [Candidatus Riflebacteria bacterium]|nr:chemotaxis response regulator protein-glutamate methylesterase [Candidatus Riflebacteria bacterium]